MKPGNHWIWFQTVLIPSSMLEDEYYRSTLPEEGFFNEKGVTINEKVLFYLRISHRRSSG